MTPIPSPAEVPERRRKAFVHIAQQLEELAATMTSLAQEYQPALDRVVPSHRSGASNLLHYLALRRRDLRMLQIELAALGLSSLGRAEGHALASVEAVLNAARQLGGLHSDDPKCPLPCDFESGVHSLVANTAGLFLTDANDRAVHIMVTMPVEAATNYSLVHDLVARGMTCMRINCAHDGPAEWRKMIDHLSRAKTALAKSCAVLMDLGGPKLRTGEIESGPCINKVAPSRDAYGRTIAPARIWLTARTAAHLPPTHADGVLHVDADWLAKLDLGQTISVCDTRERQRELKVVERRPDGCWADARATAYFANGTELSFIDQTGAEVRTEVYDIPPLTGVIALKEGELLVITRDPTPGKPASYDTPGNVLAPARIPCTLPEVFTDVRAGERVSLDDGHIVGVAEAVSDEQIVVRVHRTPSGGARLKTDKGINLPDSHISLPALTPKDKEDLRFVARHADIVGLSFANRASDVTELLAEMAQCDGAHLGVVLKVETVHGFEQLPAMLLEAMTHDRVGIMIARGDLAVECGYERLAEVQEEILWICEAAQVPAIWATQVLETLAKEGTPSRAEITDAAMGHRAECVMLNKGPHILEAVTVLDNILGRMDAHQAKKQAMLRALRVAAQFPSRANSSQLNVVRAANEAQGVAIDSRSARRAI